jgi:hypothetical protein
MEYNRADDAQNEFEFAAGLDVIRRSVGSRIAVRRNL